MKKSQFANIAIVGLCRVTIRGEATALVDFGEPVQVKGEHTLDVTSQANLRVAGQVIAIFGGPGAFMMDEPNRIRVVTSGGACVNMTSREECHVGGKGVIFVEGADTLRVDADQEAIAVDCHYVNVHDQATLNAIGCVRAEAYNSSQLNAFGVKSCLVVESSSFAARDCREVLVDEGQSGQQPTLTHLINCGSPVAMKYDPIAHTEELGYHGTYVPVEGEPGAEHIRDVEAPKESAPTATAATTPTAVERVEEPPFRKPD